MLVREVTVIRPLPSNPLFNIQHLPTMFTKIDNTIKYGKQRGEFGIQILYPGLIRPTLNDTGFATLGRIDHARITRVP